MILFSFFFFVFSFISLPLFIFCNPTPDFFFSSTESLLHLGLDHFPSSAHTHPLSSPQTGTHYYPTHHPVFGFLIFPSSHSGTLRPQPSGTALEHAGTLIKTGPPGACKLAAGVTRKQSQSNRKSLLSDSGPSLPGFLSGSRQ